jgi:DNA-directed RNA polymerase specialized sigma24 family protein
MVRIDALDDCVQQLSSRDRDLLNRKYQSAETVKLIALALHCTESAVYKSLERIHNRLYDCVEEKVKGNLKL